MKRKILLVFLSIVTVCCLALGISACSGNKETTVSSSNSSEQSSSSNSSSEDTSSSESNSENTSSENSSPAHSHNLTHSDPVAATCTTDGNIEYWYCAECGKYFSDAEATTEVSQSATVIAAKNHSLTHTDSVEATCTTDGNIEYWYCAECGKYFSDAEATTQISQSATVIAAKNHSLTHTDSVEATCTTDGNIEYWYCAECGKYFSDAEATTQISQSATVIAAKNHSLTHTDSVEATCTTDGNIEYWYCAECGKYFSDAEATAQISQSATVIAAKNHTYNSYSYDENGHWQECTACGEKTESQTHTYNENNICSVCGYEYIASSTGLGYTAVYDSDGTTVVSYTVSGIGECTDTDIVIPSTYNGSPVTAIEIYAFKDNTKITSVSIPGSVTSISVNVFSGCTSLKSVVMGYGVKQINSYMFKDCSSLASVTIPDSVTTISISAFQNCTSLESISIPDSVTIIYESAFKGCTALSNITIGNSVTSIGSNAFSDTAYYNNSNNWTDNVLYIDTYLIQANGSITGNYKIKDATTTIANYAFSSGYSLTSVTIPDSVTAIGTSAFQNCTSLESVYYSGTASQWASISFSDAYANPLYCAGNLYINETLLTDLKDTDITSISDFSFAGWNVTSITIPDSVTSIGSAAFNGCSSLVSISIPFVGSSASATSVSSSTLFGYIFGTSSYTDGTATKQFYSSTSSSYKTYYIPTTLKTVTITGGKIFYGAFYNCGTLTKVTLPDSVTSIGSYAFYGCSLLESITIPNNVSKISGSAFYNCTALTEIIFNATAMEDLSSTNNVFYCAGQSGDGITVTIGANVTKIPAYLFYPCSSSSDAPKITSVVFEDDSACTSIGTYAFNNCTSLVSVYYSGTVSEWGAISIAASNTYLTNATKYYYSESEPDYTDGYNYWYYDENGEIANWVQS
ncbi:MAG: leucine-rich repeat domain-containing protein [Clostridia bacterium]|nr:leucine-rich repeat domain-containing protein [Clostridia bacterium]